MGDRLPAFLVALKDYAHAENVDVQEMFRAMSNESDRALIVISGSLVEAALTRVIQASLRPPANRRERSELWGFQGILGNFGAKIKMAYAMRLIDSETRDRLDLFREIRNQCAHSMMPIDFGTEQLVEACCRLVKDREHLEHPLSNPDRKMLRSKIEALAVGYAVKFQRLEDELKSPARNVDEPPSHSKSPRSSNRSDPRKGRKG